MSIYTSYETHPSGQDSVKVQRHILWDRKVEGGFPGKSLFCLLGLTITSQAGEGIASSIKFNVLAYKLFPIFVAHFHVQR